jgi:acyl carrier protein
LEEEFGVSIPDEEVGNLVNYKLIELVINDILK